MNRRNRSDKPDWVPPRSNRLLGQVRERVRYLHYSLQTEKAYVYWAKAFVLWAARSGGGFRHPRDGLNRSRGRRSGDVDGGSLRP